MRPEHDVALVAQPTAEVETELRAALDQYSTALESLDVEAVKKIQPSIDARNLERAFRDMQALDVDSDADNWKSRPRSNQEKPTPLLPARAVVVLHMCPQGQAPECGRFSTS